MSPANSECPKRIALVDCNNFYVSCERVFNPAWERRPVGVLSNNDGCIVARSNELKDAGIPMGAPYFKFREPLKTMNAVVVSSNYALYGDMSARVMSTLGQFTPDMEIYSIDEAWLNLTGCAADKVDAYGREIVATIRQHTGIPVSIGIGPTKVLAKIANRICKQRKIPSQVFNLGGAQKLDAILSSVSIEDIWGIGPRWAATLKKQEIATALDLRDVDLPTMRKRYSVVMERLIRELQGVSCLEFEDIASKQQIIVSRSFGARVTDKQSLIEAVTLHVTRAAEKLHAQHSACGALQVSIRTGQHNPHESYFGRSTVICFPVATADTRKLIGTARQGIARIFKAGPRYAKAGVMLFDLVPARSVQSGLFNAGDSPKSIQLMRLVDRINRQYGKHTVFFASGITKKAWTMKQDRRTRAFTTQWTDIPLVT